MVHQETIGERLVRDLAGREVLIRGYVDAVVISCGAEVIARHPRSYQMLDSVKADRRGELLGAEIPGHLGAEIPGPS